MLRNRAKLIAIPTSDAFFFVQQAQHAQSARELAGNDVAPFAGRQIENMAISENLPDEVGVQQLLIVIELRVERGPHDLELAA